MKKTLVIVFMSTLLLIMFTGCGEKDVLQEVQDNGKLVVGISPDYPPFGFIQMVDGKDKVVGYEPMIAEEIAKELGVELVFKQMDFDGVIPALQAGEIDIAMSGLTPTEDRKKVVDFSDLLYSGNQSFLVHQADAAQYQSVDDLKGKVVGVQLGSIQQELAETVGAKEIKKLKDLGSLVRLLVNKEIDAIVISELSGKEYSKTNADVLLAPVVFESATEEGVAVAIPKNNEALQKIINDVIQQLKDTNKLDQFFVEAETLVEGE